MSDRHKSTRAPLAVKNLRDALLATLISPNERDSNLEAANVVDGLFAIARGLEAVARSIHALGNADAATPMGAIEALGDVMKSGFTEVSLSISELSSSVFELAHPTTEPPFELPHPTPEPPDKPEAPQT